MPIRSVSGFCDETKEELEFSFQLMTLSISGSISPGCEGVRWLTDHQHEGWSRQYLQKQRRLSFHKLLQEMLILELINLEEI